MTDDVGREGLPLADYEQLPLGRLGQRIRSLDADSVETLRRYEESQGHRLPVLQVIDHWLHELADGAEPTGEQPAR